LKLESAFNYQSLNEKNNYDFNSEISLLATRFLPMDKPLFFGHEPATQSMVLNLWYSNTDVKQYR